MGIGAVVNSTGKNLILERAFLSGDKFKIGTGTTTPDNSDTDLETVIAGWNGGSDLGDITTGYPLVNDADNTVKIRGFVGANQANGNTITEVSLNNSGDTTMISRDVHTGVSKSSTDRIAYIWKYKLTD